MWLLVMYIILPEKTRYREIIVNQKVPGGGRHPLAKSSITSIPSQHFRTTKEMLNDFAFLGEEQIGRAHV